MRTCDGCQRIPVSNDLTPGKLLPLPIPEGKWKSVSMDFVTDLPPDSQGHTTIHVFLCRLTKMVHLVPCIKEITGVESAELFVKHVVVR